MQTKFNHPQEISGAGLNLFPPVDASCRIVVACHGRDYSASSIARAVEDCDARVLNLNICAPDPDSQADETIVDIRIDRHSPAAVCRSLERYGFEVIATKTDTPASNNPADIDALDDDYSRTMRNRADFILRWLEM